MTFKTTLLSTVATLALAFPAVAQSGSVGLTGEGACTVAEGAPMPAGCEVHGDMEAGAAFDGSAEEFADEMGDIDMDGEAEMTAGMGETDAPSAQTDLATESMLTAGTAMPMDMDEAAVPTALGGMTVADIVGMDVHTTSDNDVGEIDYIIQAEGGYEAVIGIGGILGLGEYTVALPLDAFSVSEDNNQLIIEGYTEAELEAMPEIDESELDALPSDYVIG
ncbi:PRC-barrel domain-containing protein [Gymnodinialimonas sp.]